MRPNKIEESGVTEAITQTDLESNITEVEDGLDGLVVVLYLRAKRQFLQFYLRERRNLALISMSYKILSVLFEKSRKNINFIYENENVGPIGTQ